MNKYDRVVLKAFKRFIDIDSCSLRLLKILSKEIGNSSQRWFDLLKLEDEKAVVLTNIRGYTERRLAGAVKVLVATIGNLGVEIYASGKVVGVYTEQELRKAYGYALLLEETGVVSDLIVKFLDASIDLVT